LDLKGRKTDREENCIMMNFTACILHLILLEMMRWAGHLARTGREEVFTSGFWLGGRKGKDHWEDLGVGGRAILR
jgi:hypothetical protein